MHTWGDEGVDWTGIEDAAGFIHDYCVRWARLGGQHKEKFGTVRFYAQFGGLSLHTLFYPGHAFSRFPKWLWIFDLDVAGPVLRKLFGKLFVRWQEFIYSRAYWLAMHKWPHLRAEILNGADCPTLIKGAYRIDETPTERHTCLLGWDNEVVGKWISRK